jgi:hypothetical protein
LDLQEWQEKLVQACRWEEDEGGAATGMSSSRKEERVVRD